MPEVSLVLPVWRPDPRWFRDAVLSALDPDVDLELIVVDDGNPEPVESLLADLPDPRIRHLRIPHGGVSRARNAGTAQARGRFLRYVDADDVVVAGSTARLLDLAAGGGITYADTEVCDEELRPLGRIGSRLRGDVALDCLLDRFDCMHVSMLFPADVVRRAGPWDERLRVKEDFDFVLRCLELAPVVPGDGLATRYRRNAASATRSAGAVEAGEAATRIIVRGFLDRHPELRRSPTERAAWRMVHAAEARTALHGDRPVRAIRRALPLLRHAPREAAGIWRWAALDLLRLGGAGVAKARARLRAGLRPPPR